MPNPQYTIDWGDEPATQQSFGSKVGDFIQSLRNSKVARMVTDPVADTLGVRPAVEALGQPGLEDSPNYARLKGFLSGIGGAVSPMHPIALASLGTGVPAIAANSVIAAQGVGQATDPNASTTERMLGGVNALGGGAGALSGFLNVAKAIPKPVEGGLIEGGNFASQYPNKAAYLAAKTPAKKTAADIAREVVSARAEKFNPVQKRLQETLPEKFEDSIVKKNQALDATQEKLHSTADTATAKQLQEEWNAQRNAQLRKEYGLTEQEFSGGETIKAGPQTGRIKYVRPEEDPIALSHENVPPDFELSAAEEAYLRNNYPEQADLIKAKLKEKYAPATSSPLGELLTPKPVTPSPRPIISQDPAEMARFKSNPSAFAPETIAATETTPFGGGEEMPSAAAGQRTEPIGNAPRPASWDNYPPEVVSELDRLGAQYRSAAPGTAGREMGEIRDFFTPGKMRESWRGAKPSVGSEVPPVTPPPSDPSIPDYPAATTPEAKMNLMDQLRTMGSETGEIDPVLAARVGLGGTLGAYGAATGDDPESRIRRAVGFGAAGALLPSIATLGPRQALKEAWKSSPDIQRFNFLFGKNLPNNAIVGPAGSSLVAGIERAAMGDPRGIEALKNLFNPSHIGRSILKEWPEATQKIGRAEGHTLGPDASYVQRAASFPGRAMTTGDLVGQMDVLMKAGFSEKEARQFMLTAEPEMLKWVANIGKKAAGQDPNVLAQLMLPFKRTMANWVEQGSIRLPLVGSIVRELGGLPADVKTQVVQQLMDAGIMIGSEQLGENLTPEQAIVAQRILSNAAGVHGLGATLGLGFGAAKRKYGWDMGKIGSKMATELGGNIPLPTSQPIEDSIKYATSGFDPQKFPRGAMPGVLKPGFLDDLKWLFPQKDTLFQVPSSSGGAGPKSDDDLFTVGR